MFDVANPRETQPTHALTHTDASYRQRLHPERKPKASQSATCCTPPPPHPSSCGAPPLRMPAACSADKTSVFVSDRLGRRSFAYTPCHVPAHLGLGIDTLAGASHACATFTKSGQRMGWRGGQPRRARAEDATQKSRQAHMPHASQQRGTRRRIRRAGMVRACHAAHTP